MSDTSLHSAEAGEADDGPLPVEAPVDFIAQVRGADPLTAAQVAELLPILVPIVDADLTYDPSLSALSSVTKRCEQGPIGALLDWWLIAGAAAPSQNGLAWTLPEALGDELTAVMERLRDLRTPVPPLRWVRQRPELSVRVARARHLLDYGNHGNSKLPAERHVWGTFVRHVEPAVEALEAAHEVKLPANIDSDLERALTSEQVKYNSARWNVFFSRVRDTEHAIRDAVELQAVLQPWRMTDDFEMPRVSVPDLPVVREVARLLLAPITDTPWTVDPAQVGAALESIAKSADPGGQAWLVELTRAWHGLSDAAGETLCALIEERKTLEETAHELKREGMDVDVALITLDEDLGEARRILEQTKLHRVRRERTQTTRRELERLGRKVGTDPALSERIAQALGKLEAGDIEAAKSHSRDIGEAVRRDVGRRQLEELQELATRLVEIGAARPLLAEAQEALARVSHAPDVFLDADEFEALRDRVAQADVEAERRATRAVQETVAVAADRHDLLPSDAAHDVDALIAEAAELTNQRQWRSAEAAVQRASVIIQRRQVPAWNAEQGEDALVTHLVKFITQAHDFAETDIRRLHVALKSKRFVVLAGLSGSGKSTIARLYAEALDATAENDRFLRVAVRPNWVDATEVLGYLNPLSNRFEPGWLADVIRNCERDPDLPFFVVLDEMNLAPVEQYFADVLSAMEEARSGSTRVRIALYARGAQPDNREEWEPTVSFPENLFILGTVNIDETTRSLSDRLLDRANVLQLSVDIGRGHHDTARRTGAERSWRVRFTEWRAICTERPSDQEHDFLVELADAFTAMRIGVGVRSHIEIEVFLANAHGVLEPDAAIDLAVLQRLLPKIRGFKRDLAPGLIRLRELLDRRGLARSRRVVDHWLDPDLADDLFLDGVDAVVGLVATPS